MRSHMSASPRSHLHICSQELPCLLLSPYKPDLQAPSWETTNPVSVITDRLAFPRRLRRWHRVGRAFSPASLARGALPPRPQTAVCTPAFPPLSVRPFVPCPPAGGPMGVCSLGRHQ